MHLHPIRPWAGVPQGDPILAPLLPPVQGQKNVLPFIAPFAWSGLLGPSDPHAFWSLQKRGIVRLLLSGALPVAIWTDRTPDGVERWLRERPAKIRRGHTSSSEPVQLLDLVLEAWVSALRRWIRLASGLSLGEVLHRPGRLYFTRTHLDVFLPMAAVDLRIRRIGLDLDPGWLPWLGRVVQFKHLEG